MTKLASTFATLIALTALTSAARADDQQEEADDQPVVVTKQARDEQLPTVSVTVSPLHALTAMGEATIELRVARKVGIAAIVGGGAPYFESLGGRATVLEGGLSARYYALGTFRSGLQLGAEALFVHVVKDAEMTYASGEGVAVSPFVGYKWTHRSGFTLEGQGGASFIAVRARSEGDIADASEVSFLLNLNVGYGF